MRRHSPPWTARWSSALPTSGPAPCAPASAADRTDELRPGGAGEAEPASNAVLHGHVRGRDFRLGLELHDDGTLRIEVTDARGDRVPCVKDPEEGEAETGRGLLIVAAYAHRWGVDEAPAHAKTVWAELEPGRGKT
ncbi:ATP-binding protein [Streptomyces mirabilis]|uniref:ATP-binding protein n=1 Tax=Streptomyces mirabilis TaxID=68239 RepID=UPI0036B5B66D